MNRKQIIIILIAAGIILLGIAYYATRQAPKADVIGTGDSLPTKTTSTLWGQIKYKDSQQPASNIDLYINGTSIPTTSDGYYFFSTGDEGDAWIVFYDASNKTLYQIAENVEQHVYITSGSNQHRDFFIEKSQEPVPPFIGAAPSGTPSPSTSPTSSAAPTSSANLTACSLDSVKDLPPSKENAIKFTYPLVLCREYDAPGLGGWMGLVNSGKVKVGNLPIEFFKSSEFQNKIKNMSDTEFVTYLYRQLLRREPDAGGLNHWVNTVLGKGGTREQVFTGFVSSEEFRELYTIYYLSR